MARPSSSFPKLVGPERKIAVEDPGPSWREYFYVSFAKAWVLLGFAVIDAWIVVAWIQPLNVPLMLLSLAGGIYLEFLLFRYLWYRPGPDASSSTGAFRPTWTRPVRFGRWTPETWRLREAGRSADTAGSAAPDPSEFL